MSQLLILDNFLPDPNGFREVALAQEYRTVTGPDGESYPNVSMREPREFADLIEKAIGRPIVPRYTFLRFSTGQNPAGVHIHADGIVEKYVALLYLSLPEHCSGGTDFWKHKKSGFSYLPDERDIRRIGKSPARVAADLRTDAENPEGKWDLIETVEMKFNRAVIYPTRRFHSRASGGFGTDLKSGRVTWTTFFDVVESWVCPTQNTEKARACKRRSYSARHRRRTWRRRVDRNEKNT